MDAVSQPQSMHNTPKSVAIEPFFMKKKLEQSGKASQKNFNNNLQYCTIFHFHTALVAETTTCIGIHRISRPGNDKLSV